MGLHRSFLMITIEIKKERWIKQISSVFLKRKKKNGEKKERHFINTHLVKIAARVYNCNFRNPLKRNRNIYVF